MAVKNQESGDPIRILLLEDNPKDAKLVLHTLARAGLKVESDVVRDTAEFMEALRSRPYQLILCDYSLPGWSGAEALRWVRSSGLKMPLIYVSGTLGEDVAVDCIKNGATDYVIKGNLERLPHAVRRAMQEEELRLEKERAEAEARRSEERYRLLFDSNPHPMWVFHLATLRFLAVNESAVDHYQFSRSEFLSMTLKDIGLPEDAAVLENCVWREGTYPEKARVWRHRTKFGRIIYVEITGRNIEFEGRASALVLANDVTQLKQSEENLRLLFEQTPDGVFVADVQGRYLDVNPAGVQLLGYARDEIRSLTITDVLATEEIGRIAPEVARLEGGGVVTTEWRFKRKDGSIFDGLLLGRKLSDGRLLGILRDITESRRAEEALRESEARFRLFVEHAPAALAMFDREMRYLHVSRRWRTDYDLGDRELCGRSYYDIFPDAPERWREAHRRGLAGEVVREEDDRFDRADGSALWIRWEIRPWYDKAGDIGGIVIFTEDVAERKQAEQLLRDSEEGYRTLFESMDEGFCTIEVLFNENNECVDYRFLEVNPAFEPLTGISNARGKRMREIAPQHEEYWFSTYGKVALTGEPVRLENVASQLNRWFEVHAFRVGAPQDRKVAVFFGDITHRKQVEAELRSSEEQFRTMANAIPQLAWMANADGWIFWYNQGWYEYTGTTPQQMEGWGWQSVHDPDELARVMERWQACIATGEPFEMTFALRSAQGEFRAFLTRGAPIKDTSGKVLRWFGTHTDVEERRRAEVALRKSEERFSKAFHNSPLAITISTEADARYLDVNDTFLNLLGYKREDVIGHTATELRFWSEPSDREEMLRQLKLEEGEKVAKRNTRYRTTKGDLREAEVWAQSIELDGQPCVLAITRDVTEMRQLEAQFLQAQKMEAVGQLAGGVAHDFNNLLMIIGSYARLIPMHIGDRTKIERDATQIDEAVSRAASVTQQLLAFSRKQVLQPTVLSLNTLVQSLGKMLPRLLGEDVAMSLATHAAGKVKADTTQLEQVILNLAVNARHAMPSGGKLIIETADIHFDGGYPGHHGATIPAGNYVMLAVSDTGMGMDEETQTHIFEPFFTTKGKSGTGLGLATVYGIVKQSDGFVWVYSELGKGTTFKVYLPTVEGPEDRIGRSEVPAPDPRGTETILVAEDEAALRTVIDIYLKSLGYTVLASGNGEEALEIFRSNAQSIDLIITDVIMPGIGGPQLVRKAQEVRPGVLAIYISGYTDRALDRETIGAGAPFLQKPFGLGSLAVKIRETLGADLEVEEQTL